MSAEDQEQADAPDTPAERKRFVKQFYHQLDRFRVRFVAGVTPRLLASQRWEVFSRSLRSLSPEKRIELVNAWRAEGSAQAKYFHQVALRWAAGDLAKVPSSRVWTGHQALFTWSGEWGTLDKQQILGGE